MDPVWSALQHCFAYKSRKSTHACSLCSKYIGGVYDCFSTLTKLRRPLGKKKTKTVGAFVCQNRGCESVVHADCRKLLLGWQAQYSLDSTHVDPSILESLECKGEFSGHVPITAGMDNALVEFLTVPEDKRQSSRTWSMSEFLAPVLDYCTLTGTYGRDLYDVGPRHDSLTPLHRAALDGDDPAVQAICRKLFASPANNLSGSGGGYASGETKDLEDVQLNSRTRDGATPLMVATQQGHTEVVKTLIGERAGVNISLDNGATPLFVAAQKGYGEIVRLLVEARAEFHLSLHDGKSVGSYPLFVAVQNAHEGVCAHLLKVRASPLQQAENGVTSLHVAASKGQVDVLKAIFKHSRSKTSCLTAKDGKGNTALHAASASGRSEAVRLLLVHGALLTHNDQGLLPSQVICSLSSKWWSDSEFPDIYSLINRYFETKNPVFELRTPEEKRGLYVAPSRRSLAKFDHSEMKTALRESQEHTGTLRCKYSSPIEVELQSAWKEKPENGLQTLRDRGLIGSDPGDAGQFLFIVLGRGELDRVVAGEYLGKEKHIEVLEEFCNCFSWQLFDLDFALRDFLFYFRLPGEAQQIDRVVQTFATRYHQCNPYGLIDTDVAYILSFSIIMLNTDAHNPMVQKKMTKVQFLNNHKSVFARKQQELKELELPEIPKADWEYLLGHLYDRIVAAPLAFVSETGECNTTTKGVLKATWVRYAEPPQHTTGYTSRGKRSRSRRAKETDLKRSRPVWQKSLKWITLCHMGAGSDVGSYSLIMYEDIEQTKAERIIPLIDVAAKPFQCVRKDVEENKLEGLFLVRLQVVPILEDMIDETEETRSEAKSSRMFFLGFQTDNERREWLAALRLYSSSAKIEVKDIEIKHASLKQSLLPMSASLPDSLRTADAVSPMPLINTKVVEGSSPSVPFAGVASHDDDVLVNRQSLPDVSKDKSVAWGTKTAPMGRHSIGAAAQSVSLIGRRRDLVRPSGPPPPIPQRKDLPAGCDSKPSLAEKPVQAPSIPAKPPSIPAKPTTLFSMGRGKAVAGVKLSRSATRGDVVVSRTEGSRIIGHPTSGGPRRLECKGAAIGHAKSASARANPPLRPPLLTATSDNPLEDNPTLEPLAPPSEVALSPRSKKTRQVLLRSLDPPPVPMDRPLCPVGADCDSSDPEHWLTLKHTVGSEENVDLHHSPRALLDSKKSVENSEHCPVPRKRPPTPPPAHHEMPLALDSFLDGLAASLVQAPSNADASEVGAIAEVAKAYTVACYAATDQSTSDHLSCPPIRSAVAGGEEKRSERAVAMVAAKRGERMVALDQCIQECRRLVALLVSNPNSPEITQHVVTVGGLGRDVVSLLRGEGDKNVPLCDAGIVLLKSVVIGAKAFGASRSPEDKMQLACALRAWLQCLQKMQSV